MIRLFISKAPDESDRPFRGGEFQFAPNSYHFGNSKNRRGFRLGRYDAWFQLTPGLPGTVQTVFTFQRPYTDKRREFDFEFNGGTGRMECAFHMQPLDAGSSQAIALSCEVPPEAFTDFQKWSIVANADRTEWLYNDQVMARYIQGQGFDKTVQMFNPTHSAVPYTETSPALLNPHDAHWHLTRQNFYAQYWCSDTESRWLGGAASSSFQRHPNPPPFQLNKLEVVEFSPSSIAFTEHDWATSGSSLTIHNVPPDGFRPNSIQYQINNGSWVPLGHLAPGTHTIAGREGDAIRVRSVAASINGDYILVGDDSDVKTAGAGRKW